MGLKPRIRRGIQSKVEVIKIIIFKHGGVQEVLKNGIFKNVAALAATINTATLQTLR